MEKMHDSWEDFIAYLPGMHKEIVVQHKKPIGHISPTLFRGQSNSKWALETTLERFTTTRFTDQSYLALMLRINRIIESHTGYDWKVDPSLNPWEIETEIRHSPPFYEFMVYLRHHGFPSPLLDWTRSPYIAAFFAFRDAKPGNHKSVAIYSFVEYAGQAKSFSSKEPHIKGLGPYVKTHRRHHLQQGEYTVCRKVENEKYYYCSHEDVLKQNSQKQDVSIKHLIPSREKSKVLSELQSMNINAFSLFGTEEALMEMLAFEEIGEKIDFLFCLLTQNGYSTKTDCRSRVFGNLLATLQSNLTSILPLHLPSRVL